MFYTKIILVNVIKRAIAKKAENIATNNRPDVS